MGAAPIVVYCHIEKAGGTTISNLLRRHFGLRHVDVGRRQLRETDAARREAVRRGFGAPPYHYGPDDLRVDLRLYPGMRSLAGHLLHPFVDFGPDSERLRWFTVLRHPIARFRSQYLHEVEGSKRRHLEIPVWLERFVRDDMMVRKLAGASDLEAARRIVDERLRFVGLQERFDQTLVLLRHRLGLDGLRLAYPAPLNTADKRIEDPERRRLREWALDQLARHERLVEECNRKDLELYRYVETTVWPRQVADFGGELALAEAVARDVRQEPDTLAERLRIAESLLYRNLVYKPYLRALRAWRSRAGASHAPGECGPAGR